ncbi:MAG: 4Fe-4S binding protein [Bacteroidetes bacterium]|nr:4Fe-4S binding protein [Bacteroidota bacterium]
MTKFGWKTVRKIRVVVSLTFLVMTTALFLDPWHLIPSKFVTYVTSLQIVPVLLKTIMSGGAVAVGGLIFVVAMTLLFGRVYCSTICPFGTLQDILVRVSRKINHRKRFKHYKAPQWLQYPILAVGAVMAVLSGSMIVGDLLDPFSNYGRLIAGFALPVILLVNNVLAGLLGHFGIYLFYDIPVRIHEVGMLFFALLFFATVVYLSMTEGRLFCNSFCPAGAILSLMSRISAVRLVIRGDLCNDCGACDRVCKAQCIDSEARRIDFSACVGCFNCLPACPTNAIEYANRLGREGRPEPVVFDSGRREFFKNVGVPAAALLIAPGVVESGIVVSSSRQPISPPGSISIGRFTSLCTACHLCVVSCPTNVLKPSFLEYGLAGMSQPMMKYEFGYCNYDCTVCGEVCPTGAILKTDVAAKKLTQIGSAKFNKDDCIVVAKKKDCSACSEHCPTKAVLHSPGARSLTRAHFFCRKSTTNSASDAALVKMPVP